MRILLILSEDMFNPLSLVARLSKSFSQITGGTQKIGSRTLYSASALGVDNYVKTREKVKMQFNDIEAKFKIKMHDFVEPTSNNMIFTEDLKHIVHLIEPNQEDLTLVEQMMLKFSQQNKELRFGSFVFGPVVMRMYYHLNKPKEALEIFRHSDMNGFFDQLISFQILMDLLLKNGMYNEVLEVFETIKKKQLQGAKYPKNAVVLTFAACYYLDTEESCKYANKLWSELNEVGHYPMRRAGTFAAALALSQNAPHIALEILTSLKQQSYVTIRNLKVAALADLGRPDDALPILRSVLEVDESNGRKHTFVAEVIERLRESVQKIGKPEISQEFERIVKQLSSLGHISDSLLSVQLCSEINVSQHTQTREQRVLSASFQPRTRSTYRRPGLQDMM